MLYAKRGFTIPLHLLRRAKEFGLDAGQLQSAVVASARVTHPEGNRRWHEFLFRVEGNRVMDLKVVDGWAPGYTCKTCRDLGKLAVFDGCENCNGDGCDFCDEGLVSRMIYCPMCQLGKESGNGKGAIPSQ
jgi:RecJ-like exonuclease